VFFARIQQAQTVSAAGYSEAGFGSHDLTPQIGTEVDRCPGVQTGFSVPLVLTLARRLVLGGWLRDDPAGRGAVFLGGPVADVGAIPRPTPLVVSVLYQRTQKFRVRSTIRTRRDRVAVVA
jgi:hypothetical protein